MGAMLKCSFGAAPGTLAVLPANRVLTGTPAATIMDHVPLVNVPSFGTCSSLGNPTVAAATSAASGVLTPQPCVPVTGTPWAPGAATVTVGGLPALDAASKLACSWAGVVEVVTPGQTTEQVP